MITRTEDLRPGRYLVRRKGSDHRWDELTILPFPPDSDDYVVFSLKSSREDRMVYGLVGLDHDEIPHIHYAYLAPIPIEIRPIDAPASSISHIRRVEL